MEKPVDPVILALARQVEEYGRRIEVLEQGSLIGPDFKDRLAAMVAEGARIASEVSAKVAGERSHRPIPG